MFAYCCQRDFCFTHIKKTDIDITQEMLKFIQAFSFCQQFVGILFHVAAKRAYCLEKKKKQKKKICR